MTSNCLIEPQHGYRERIFTIGPVGWPGVRHLDVHDVSAAIEAAQALARVSRPTHRQTSVLVGFGADAVPRRRRHRDRRRQVRRDPALLPRSAAATAPRPAATTTPTSPSARRRTPSLLTLGCGKYRFNHLDFGDIGGIPRLLDVGQCNDSYSAIQIAAALADAFDCGVNDLPLSLVISWFEQKAVAVLLTLLAAGPAQHPARPDAAGLPHPGPAGHPRRAFRDQRRRRRRRRSAARPHPGFVANSSRTRIRRGHRPLRSVAPPTHVDPRHADPRHADGVRGQPDTNTSWRPRCPRATTVSESDHGVRDLP